MRHRSGCQWRSSDTTSTSRIVDNVHKVGGNARDRTLCQPLACAGLVEHQVSGSCYLNARYGVDQVVDATYRFSVLQQFQNAHWFPCMKVNFFNRCVACFRCEHGITVYCATARRPSGSSGLPHVVLGGGAVDDLGAAVSKAVYYFFAVQLLPDILNRLIALINRSVQQSWFRASRMGV